MLRISGGSAYPFAGHSSFCKLDSVLFPPSINQTLPEASQQGISERECAEIRGALGREKQTGPVASVWKSRHFCCQLPAAFLTLFLPFFPHGHVSK